jgi:hypothetical protein
MSMTDPNGVLKTEILQQRLTDLVGFVQTAWQDGVAVHQIEHGIWQQLLQLGHDCLALLFTLAGDGDRGPTITLPNGADSQRLPALHPRPYVSIFGRFLLQRVVYGSREGQALDFVPLDNRLQLPASDFSYVLQDWDQNLCVEQAFGQARSVVAKILGLQQSVDSLEHMNQAMATAAPTFLLNRPLPDAGGEILVTSADGKGIVMRRTANDPAPKTHRTKGDKASQKRMATVGTVYTVDRYVRTPEQVVAALFRDEPERSRDRPQPQHKHVWASLAVDEEPGSGTAQVFAWLVGEVVQRDPDGSKPRVYLSDGQETLWEARAYWLPQRNSVDILDLLHVTPRLWQAAHVFHPEKSVAAEQFVRHQLLRVLQGKATGVLRRFRALGRARKLTTAKQKTLRAVCAYLRKNRHRMCYDEYLAAGYPIASGAIEGACRHLVKDRMERAGMHWTVAGAQAMLNVRSVYCSDAWDEYQQYRIEREQHQLYPYRDLVAKPYALPA